MILIFIIIIVVVVDVVVIIIIIIRVKVTNLMLDHLVCYKHNCFLVTKSKFNTNQENGFNYNVIIFFVLHVVCERQLSITTVFAYENTYLM